MKTSSVFEKDSLFEYNKDEKIRSEIIKWSVLILIAVFFGSFFLNFFEGTFIDTIFTFIGNSMFSGTIFGLFLFGLIAGLFFLSVPIEVAYIAFLTKSDNDLFVFVFVFLGLFFSYLLDYQIGLNFSTISKKLISTKQFYKVKTKINQYGNWTIFFFNVLPLPSQLLTFICGVFKYNRTRLFSIWAFAWIIKLSLILIIASFFHI